jgi:hypothetical protein
MVHKFVINCDFSGKKIPVTFYIGNPSPQSTHPLSFQSNWLSKQKGGNVPAEIMDSFARLKEVSMNSKISFEELCKYVVDELQANASFESDFNRAKELSRNKK